MRRNLLKGRTALGGLEKPGKGNTFLQGEERMKKPKVTVIYDRADDLQLRHAFRLLAEFFREQHGKIKEEVGSVRR